MREIRVRDGQKVRAGEPLVVVGDVRSDAELSLLARSAARRARPQGARSPRKPRFTALRRSTRKDLPSRGSRAPGARTALIRRAPPRHSTSRSRARNADPRGARAGRGARSQIAADRNLCEAFAEELELNEKLAKQGFVHARACCRLQRTAADYRSRLGEVPRRTRAGAPARRRAGRAHRQSAQQLSADGRRRARGRHRRGLREIEERLRPSKDQVDRQAVRSPVDGEVMATARVRAGRSASRRRAHAEVVPSNERLVVEARIRPRTSTMCCQDAKAKVRLAAYDARTTPLLPGRYVRVARSPDRPQTGESWYAATVEVDAPRSNTVPKSSSRPACRRSCS